MRHDTKSHLAQINIARACAPLDDASMHDFVTQLDAVNRIADEHPGFVWRLKDEHGGPSSYVRAFDDPLLLVNLTVWRSIDALREFTYGAAHVPLLRDRGRWFEKSNGPSFALWWIPAGDLPTVADGLTRLALLATDGPTTSAFTFRHPFPSPTLAE